MGQHKHNPTAIAAKNGELPPKKRYPGYSKTSMNAAACALGASMVSSYSSPPTYDYGRLTNAYREYRLMNPENSSKFHK